MKKLGFGLMRLPTCNNDRSQIDMTVFQSMVDTFLARGFTYFDTAYFYHNGMSEAAFREAVVKRYPRDSFTITDKMPLADSPTREQMEEIFACQLERCGVDYFDYYWLHALSGGRYEHVEAVGGFDFLKELKAAGKTKHIGFSYHDSAQVLDRILSEHPETEYVQLQLNYLDWEDPKVEARKCYEVCCKHKKPVIVMEPVKGGALSAPPESVQSMLRSHNPDASFAEWAIRYAASLDNVMVVLSGMSNEAQMLDNTGYMDAFQPLDEQQTQLLAQAADAIRQFITIPCTTCRYCTDGCPERIPIPDLFNVYNHYKRFPTTQLGFARMNYDFLTKSAGKASHCVGCKRCESHCPQQIEITKWLKEITAVLEK